MDKEYMLENAPRFVYELSKYFPEEEKAVFHVKTDDEIILLSSRKLYIMTWDIVFRYEQDVYENISLEVKDLVVTINLADKEYQLTLLTQEDADKLLHFYRRLTDQE